MILLTSCVPRCAPTTPPVHYYTDGLGYSPFARHYWGNHCYFLFLQVLRCFSSLRLPPYLGKDSRPSACWVVPFGNPRIKGHLHLPRAYRSLSRPSSPPGAKASTRRPNSLSPIKFRWWVSYGGHWTSQHPTPISQHPNLAHTFSCNIEI